MERHVDSLFEWCTDIEKELTEKEQICFDFDNIQPELETAKVRSLFIAQINFYISAVC